MKYLSTVLVLLMFIACGKDDAPGNIDKPTGSINAIPVYNHAYNENYGTDQIDQIILNANNAYILIDPFQDNVTASITAIKANGNQVGAYISIVTGEDWSGYLQLKPILPK